VNAEIELIGAHVLLRPLSPLDAESLFEAVRESVAAVGRWLSWCHADYCFDDACNYLQSRAQAWADGTEYSFGVFERSTGRLVGGAGINFLDWTARRGNLGYWIRTSAAGHGYASGATRALARWGLNELQLQRIEIVAAVGNIGSQRAALKAGAVREGVLRNRCRVGEVAHDAVMLSFIPGDFPDVPSQAEGR
jgi:ribosomal-protein-serine acetyltransferase